ncbi:hypothetical protein GCM10011533_05370 [Streptosporangium jomthongense]|uniref:Uncharacterized protein n=1 Tax=Marinobacter aromaticivorans TaxID=1494078 RepID=A0ABW2IRR0_9GAMM|nr:hypothetical protein [Marinobacter aromaticivorans]GGE55787.1 hypothetical protein GCM10011533_05370 [Streptosporangium jomthongense]
MNPKHLICALFFATLSAATLPVHAETEDSSVDKLKQETRELGEALQEYSADQKDQAEDAIDEMLSALDKRIAELEKELAENWNSMNNKARERAQDSLASLREQREHVQDWYNELKASSASAWERAKKGFADAYEAFSEQWNETERDLTLDQEKKSKSI